MKYYQMIAMALASLPYHVSAASPVSNVGTSKVDAGALSVEQRMGYTLDESGDSSHQRFRMRQHLDYGWNGWYATRFVVEQNKLDGDNLEYANVSVENRFQLFEKNSDGWDGGFRLIYGHRDGDKTPHEIDIRLMAGVPLNDQWEWRHNTVLEHDIGENSRSGIMLELRNQITHKTEFTNDYGISYIRLGAEMFNDFGRLNELSGYSNQEHQFGPVTKISFDNGAYVQAGYRAGISQDSADHLFKIFIGRNFSMSLAKAASSL